MKNIYLLFSLLFLLVQFSLSAQTTFEFGLHTDFSGLPANPNAEGTYTVSNANATSGNGNTYSEYTGPTSGPFMNRFVVQLSDISGAYGGSNVGSDGWFVYDTQALGFPILQANGTVNVFPNPPATRPWQGTGGTTSGGILPVEWAYFQANNKSGTVELQWGTASEDNNKGFELEYSTDAKEWEMIDFIAGFGTSAEAQDYSYLHYQPQAGDNFYRLRQVDYDGAFEHSDIVSVELEGSTELSVYPNPTKENVFLILPESTYQKNLAIQITDSFGRVVWQGSQYASTAHLPLTIPAHLASGHYLISVQQDRQVYQARVFKM